jgi:hypothetical protein
MLATKPVRVANLFAPLTQGGAERRLRRLSIGNGQLLEQKFRRFRAAAPRRNCDDA